MSVKFGIIAVDYEHHVPRNGMIEGIKSISEQTYKNFDVFICHDGQKSKPYSHEFANVKISFNAYYLNTIRRMNNWGHSSRDFAMRFACANTDCDYFLHFNIDNYLFPNALNQINETIMATNTKVVVFSINHYKLNKVRSVNPRYFPGVPPRRYNIDAMQLVAHKDVWREVGFWFKKYEQSDGEIYETICSKNRWEHIDEVLGNNY